MFSELDQIRREARAWEETVARLLPEFGFALTREDFPQWSDEAHEPAKPMLGKQERLFDETQAERDVAWERYEAAKAKYRALTWRWRYRLLRAQDACRKAAVGARAAILAMSEALPAGVRASVVQAGGRMSPKLLARTLGGKMVAREIEARYGTQAETSVLEQAAQEEALKAPIPDDDPAVYFEYLKQSQQKIKNRLASGRRFWPREDSE